MDEATSALDNISQKQVAEQLDKLACTRIVVAHRLSTIRHCSRIIVLDHGNLAMDGTPREVFAKADELQKLGLDVPLSVELGARLRADGIDLPQAIVTEEDLVQALGAATGYAEEKGGAALGD